MKRWVYGLILLFALLAQPAYALEEVQGINLQDGASATGNGGEVVVTGYNSIGLDITISDTAEVTFEGNTFDGGTFRSLLCKPSTSSTPSATASASSQVQCNVAGLYKFRARISSHTGGTVTVKGQLSTAVFANGGGTGGTLTVAEEDGAPSVSSVNTITVPNGALTDDGSGAVSLAEVQTLDNAFDNGKIIDGATSEANGFCVGGDAASKRVCIWHDATTGLHILPDEAANTKTEVMTNQTWCVFDVEGDACQFTSDPDSIGAGSGTLTAATSHQIVASNLGVEFTESDTNAACAAGNYNIYADTSETRLKTCENGTTYKLRGPQGVRKTADETLGNSTTVQADDELLFPIDASGFYTIHLYAIIQSPAAADFKFNWSLPAGAAGQELAFHPSSSDCQAAGTTTSRESPLATEMGVSTEADGANCVLIVEGQVLSGGTAGNVVFQWAKLAADAGTTRVMTNSYLIWQKL